MYTSLGQLWLVAKKYIRLRPGSFHSFPVQARRPSFPVLTSAFPFPCLTFPAAFVPAYTAARALPVSFLPWADRECSFAFVDCFPHSCHSSVLLRSASRIPGSCQESSGSGCTLAWSFLPYFGWKASSRRIDWALQVSSFLPWEVVRDLSHTDQ